MFSASYVHNLEKTTVTKGVLYSDVVKKNGCTKSHNGTTRVAEVNKKGKNWGKPQCPHTITSDPKCQKTENKVKKPKADFKVKDSRLWLKRTIDLHH